jgi:NitT/TauT family transport system permease protein
VAGIRISVGVGWMCVVAAEMFGVSYYGLGTWLWQYYALHQMNRVMAYMIVLGLIGLAMDWCLRFLERRVSKGEV